MSVMDSRKLIELVASIAEDAPSRMSAMAEVQRLVWSGGVDQLPPNAQNILRDLAYDLDFFEPNEQVRAQSPALYGPERLEEEIRSTVRQLAEIGLRK